MDWGIIILKILAVMILVLLNGFFVAAEFALVKIRETQLDPLVAKNHRRAKIARWIINNLDTSLSAAQLGITLASLVLGWIGEPVFADLLRPVFGWLYVDSHAVRHGISFVVGLSVITFLHIVVGEQAPKWLAIQKPLQTSLWVAQPLVWFRKISYPFIWILNQSSLWILSRFGIQPVSEAELGHSEEELRLLFSGVRKNSGGSKLGRDIVLNALDLRNRNVRDVMRPRQEIVFFDTESTIAECFDLAEKSRYSRFPLCESGNLDKTLGVIHIKDLYARRTAKVAAELLSVARKLIYVPETSRLEKLLHLFLERKLHFAMVVDEYGGTVGIVTLENILEELVGQIQDEFDQEQPLLKKHDERVWEISGALPLHDLSDLVGETLQEDGITTTSGWVTHRLGGFPKTGDSLSIGDFDLRVEAMEGLRVAKLKLIKREILSPEPQENRDE